jgi:hypothetical protein
MLVTTFFPRCQESEEGANHSKLEQELRSIFDKNNRVTDNSGLLAPGLTEKHYLDGLYFIQNLHWIYVEYLGRATQHTIAIKCQFEMSI